MDQVQVRVKKTTKGHESIFADPKMRGYHDLLVKGGSFYAVFDPDSNLWSQDLQRLGELIDRDVFLGRDTVSAIEGGVVNGIVYEVEGYIRDLERRYPSLRIIFTGGDSNFFAKRVKKTIFATYDLVAYGLNRILEYNAK